MINYNFSIGNDHHQIMNQPRGWEPPQEMVGIRDDGEGRPGIGFLQGGHLPADPYKSTSVWGPVLLGVISPHFKTGVLGPTLPFFANNKISRSSKWTNIFLGGVGT